MTSAIQIFNHPEFGDIRTIADGETVLFCGKDIADALGYLTQARLYPIIAGG